MPVYRASSEDARKKCEDIGFCSTAHKKREKRWETLTPVCEYKIDSLIISRR